MKKWSVFAVYAEDYDNVYKLIIPAPSKKEAELFATHGGLGIVKTKEISELKINLNYLITALRQGDFNENEIDVICRLVEMTQLDMR